jgi:hypothetical protein
MRVEGVLAAPVRDQLVKLYLDRGASQVDALLRTASDLDEIERVLGKYGGAPPDAVVRPRGTGGVWWLYANGVWIGYTQEDRYHGWPPFGRWVRAITVVAAGRPPDAAGPQ